MSNNADTSTVNQEKIKMYAKTLRLPSFVNYEDIIRTLSSSDGYDEFLVRIMRRESEIRQHSGQNRRIKAAHFPDVKTLDEFDTSRLQHVTDSAIRELASCAYITNKQNIVMIGNPGSGKTHLATALGFAACMNNFKVRFYNAGNLAIELVEASNVKRFSKLENALSGLDLLIIDELSYLTFNRFQSELLFHVVSERSERASVIITTNLEFSSWATLFDNNMMVAALIDRVTYRSFVLNMNTDTSYRLDESRVAALIKQATKVSTIQKDQGL